MKKIDKLLLHAFIPAFILLLGLVMFVMTIQTFFLLFNEIAGKGLGIYVYAKILFYIGLSVLPDAFPIAILVASLIVFGTLSENFEWTAMRSAGLSLQRILRYPFILITILSGALFCFTDYIHPHTRSKAYEFLVEVLSKRSALFIQPNVICNHIPNYTIHVKRKISDKGDMEGITVYDYTQTHWAVAITTAEKGKLYTTPDENYLVMELYNGHNYIEELPSSDNSPKRKPGCQWYRSNFASQKIRIKVPPLGKSDVSYLIDTKTHSQLQQIIQERMKKVKEEKDYSQKLLTQKAMHYFENASPTTSPSIPPSEQAKGDPMINLPTNMDFLSFHSKLLALKEAHARDNKKDKDKEIQSYDPIIKSIVLRALHSVHYINSRLASQGEDEKKIKAILREALFERERRLALSSQCIIMFLLAASLGSLIRRGGFGFSIMISSIFILLKYILFSVGKDWSVDGKILSPFAGAWMANFILSLFCVLFVVRAQQGIGLPSINWHTFRSRIRKIYQ